MANRLVLTGHGHYGSGLLSSLNMIYGSVEAVSAIDFQEEDSDLTLAEKYRQCLVSYPDDEFIFICDLLGGTPFRVATELIQTRENAYTVVGANMGALLEALIEIEQTTIEVLVAHLVENTLKYVQAFKKIECSMHLEEEQLEGI